MTGVGHMPARPTWGCTACGEAWPCPPRQARLVEEYAGTPATLRALMSMRLADAASDLRTVPAGALRERFLGWLPGQARL